MDTLLTLGLWGFLIALIVGLTDPRKVTFGEIEPTRRNVFRIYGIGFTLLFALFTADNIVSFLSYFLVFGTIVGLIATIVDPGIFSQKWSRKQLLPLWGFAFLVSVIGMGALKYQILHPKVGMQSISMGNKSLTGGTITPTSLWGVRLGQTIEETKLQFSYWENKGRLKSDDKNAIRIEAERKDLNWGLVFTRYNQFSDYKLNLIDVQYASSHTKGRLDKIIDDIGHPDGEEEMGSTKTLYWYFTNSDIHTTYMLINDTNENVTNEMLIKR